jgi:hypothetical protein
MIPVPTLPPPVFAAPTPAAHVPSEFTRILSSATPPAVPAVQSAPPNAAPNAQAAAPARKPSNLPLIIALNVVAILAIALVAYFLIKK